MDRQFLEHVNRINFQITGEGPPVILVHGIAASLFDWQYLIPDLVKGGFSTYALDLLGHGESEKPDEQEHYHSKSLYAHLAAWISSLNLDQPPLLIGHSLGGFLCLKYALKNTNAVRGLVLIDPLYTHAQLSPVLRMLNRRPGLGERALEMAPLWLIQAIMGWDVDAAKNISQQIRQQIAEDFKRASPKITHIVHTIEDLSHSLTGLESPTLVVWGEKDLTLNPDSFPLLVDRLSNATGFPVPGCGHQPHLGKPDLVNSQVLQFLAQWELP